ncbi:hypothetical protein H4R34_004417 [Dimargaris verticillata]|uniref:AP complex subunit beta n=1 Tax=Dimargaris verticillata TaxID=2761393 RepID=A0A9W8AYW1_9FUNG|nr:hypothetical protein H4R34_004417 [Dimargaris verticillata]
MSDAKYFQRGKLQELRAELLSEKNDKKYAKKKIALKKVVANMTMGSDMSPLCTEVVACMTIPNLEVKKMVYLYLVNYGRNRPEIANLALHHMLRDSDDHNPLVRAQAIRTMSYLYVDRVVDALCDPLRHSLKDRDPYVRKTAALCVVKLCMYDRSLVEEEQFIDMLKSLLSDNNPAVVANAVAALTEISEISPHIKLRLNHKVASKLIQALNQCSEWGQTYILEALMFYTPQEPGDAETLAERILPRLQHANSAVVLSTVKVIIYLLNYMTQPDALQALCQKLTPPLITLLNAGPEVQYVALRNMLLIIQRRPDILKNQLKAFFCKYNDPIYVKLAKLEILTRLTTPRNVRVVLLELQEYAAEVDVDVVRKAVRSIGRLAIQIEEAASACVDALLGLIRTKVNYVVQEAVVVIKDIFRKYPNQYENIIGILCENLDSLDDAEAKAAMIWIIGQYADRIENSDEVLESFLDAFLEETTQVQLALLTATVKLFIKRPTLGQDLVPKVLKWATEEVDNPDLRDRGYIYWRLLSTDPAAAKAIVLSEKPDISAEAENLDPVLLEELLMNISSLASIYHKPPSTFIAGAKRRHLTESKVLDHDRTWYTGGLTASSHADRAQSLTSSVPNGDRGNLGEVDATSDQDASLTLDIMPNPYAADESAPVGLASHSLTQGLNHQLIDLLGLDFTAPGPDAAATPNDTAPDGSVGVDSAQGGLTGFANNYGDGQAATNYAQLESDFLKGVGATTAPNPAEDPNNPFGHAAAMQASALSSHSGGGLASPLAAPTGLVKTVGPTAGNGDLLANRPTIQKAFTNTFDPTHSPREFPPSSVTSGDLTGAAPEEAALDTLGQGIKQLQVAEPTAAVPSSPLVSSPSASSGTMNQFTALASAATDQPYVPPKTVLLSAPSAKGLEIQGVFARRQGHLALDLTFVNWSAQPVGDFAIQFNRNSFGLWPAAPLAAPVLPPQQSFDTTVPLTTNGPVQPMNPVTNIQIALKTSLGVFYFQTSFLLHILLVEAGQLEQNSFLSTWQEIPDAMQKIGTVYSLQYQSMLDLRQKLHRNNIFTIAERAVNQMTHFYLSAKTVDGSTFLTELRLDGNFQACYYATKTYASHLVQAYHTALEAILSSGSGC